MPQSVYVILGAAFTAVVSIALGRLLLRATGLPLRRSEEDPLALVAGSALLSLVVFLLLVVGLGRKGIFLITGGLIVGAAVWRGAHRPRAERFERLPRFWRWLWIAVFAAFTLVYVATSMAPEVSADGTAYHLSFVARYVREHRLVFIPTNMYAQLSQGIEMLYVPAFSIGRYSAAALVHTAFLIALSLAILNYGRRIGHPTAGVAASLLVYASPLFGKVGASAYIDVATAAIVFAVFYLLEVWRERPDQLLPLAVIGLVAGFGYAAKYTAFLAVPYAMIYAVRQRRDWQGPALIAVCSLILILPWVTKNEILVGNPVSPMMNSVFPNPVVSVAFEKDWSAMMRRYNLPTLWRIPWELTMRGEYLTGFFGGIFLLAPVALAAIQYPQGRRLLTAFVVFALPYPMNIGARFLIPATPFVALAMGLAWNRWAVVLACVTVLHAVSSWPSVLPLYCGRYAWRIPDVPIRAALRLEPEEQYLTRMRPDYPIVRSIERLVPPGQRVFAVNGLAEAYTSRELIVGFQSSPGQTLTDMLAMVNGWEMQPTRIIRLALPSGRARRLRIEETTKVPWPAQWSVHEVRLFNGEHELPRHPEWRIDARPNPWEVQLAFDNSPVTRWRSKQPVEPGMYIEVNLPEESAVTHVDVYTSADCDAARLGLLDWSNGAWKRAGAEPQKIDIPPPRFLGRAAAQEWKARHIDYLVLANSDWAAPIILQQAAAWKLTPVITQGDYHLFRNDAGLPQLDRVEKGTGWRTTSESTVASPVPRP